MGLVSLVVQRQKPVRRRLKKYGGGGEGMVLGTWRKKKGKRGRLGLITNQRTMRQALPKV